MLDRIAGMDLGKCSNFAREVQPVPTILALPTLRYLADAWS